MENYESVIDSYKKLFRKTYFTDDKTLIKVTSGLYQALYQQYDIYREEDNVKAQFEICNYIDKNVLTKLKDSVSKNQNKPKSANALFQLHRKMFALSARRITRNFAFYMESVKKTDIIWDKTMSTMNPVFYYADGFISTDVMNLMRVSCMPGLGKSYAANLIVANMLGNNPYLKILRITFSEDLIIRTTKQIKNMIKSQAYAEIFPWITEKGTIFTLDNKDTFELTVSGGLESYFGVTREGQASGKRAKVVIIDDVLKGELECHNASLMKKIVDRYDSDWSSRADDDKQKTLLIGTMWSDKDLLNVMYERELSKGIMRQSKDFKYTLVSEDKSSVFISIPALDENDNSTCPKRFSNKYLHTKRKFMDEYMWKAVYQQSPIAPEGLEFNYSNLIQYDKLPNKKPESRYASLDPARRGKNYVAMPILYRYEGEDKYHLVDFLFQRKSMKELYDKIVDKIIQHKLQRLLVECNTDTSLKEVLEKRLQERGYLGCVIEEHYSTKNKEQRIKDNQGLAKNMIIYPSKGKFAPVTEMGKAMDQMTSYSFEYPNKYDDAIDAIILFVMHFIEQVNKFNGIQFLDRKELGF